MQIFLSRELWTLIYEFDPTYREQHAKVLQEMRGVLHLFHTFLICNDPAQYCRRHTKANLEELCRFLHIKMPKHRTKMGLASMLQAFVSCIVPASFDVLVNQA